MVKECKGKSILEVGNVLSHYFPTQHTILDKYEKAPGVINSDVVDFRPAEKYDLIVSISTLEHVGWDEKPRKPRKILYALENLKRCCAPGGQIVVTLPLGYNREMDKLLKRGDIRFTERCCLKRISRDNKWIEVEYDEIRHAKYNAPFPSANAVIIGIVKKKR
jgi:SAM-dependent methyltransferase